MKRKHARGWLLAGVTGWLATIGAGIAVLTSHSRTPGPVGEASASWPAGVNIRQTPGVPALLVFLHPECPCSRASLAELGRVLAKNGRVLQVIACMAQWNGDPRNSPLWRAAERIPGVQLVADAEGRIASRFGAETSGTAVLYDGTGRLVFLGGITGARGHEGENAGAATLLRQLHGQSSSDTRANVYGCSIF